MISRNNFSWKNNQCFIGNELIGEVLQDYKFPKLFWCHWVNGDKSQDFYNLSRAKQHLINSEMNRRNLAAYKTANDVL